MVRGEKRIVSKMRLRDLLRLLRRPASKSIILPPVLPLDLTPIHSLIHPIKKRNHVEGSHSAGDRPGASSPSYRTRRFMGRGSSLGTVSEERLE